MSIPVAPRSRSEHARTGLIGIVGGGQLGRMLALAGIPLGLRFRFLEPDPDCPARDVGEVVCADYDDERAIATFAQGLDAATSEFENAPAKTLEQLAWSCPRVFPPADAFRICQDRLLEKQLFREVGLETPRFAPISTPDDIRRAIEGVLENQRETIGLPCILKTRRLGYDGKGQAVIRAERDIDAAFSSVLGTGARDSTPELILESFVPFEREVSLICVRASTGDTRFYPLVENHHAGGILRLTLAPAPSIEPRLQETAERYARDLLDKLGGGYVGVLAIEFFIVGRGPEAHLLGNEMAPRVHNSGHWTIEAAQTSQFENHLRAILGWPLGPTAMRDGSEGGHAAMLNLIGGPIPDPAAIPREPWLHLHLYGKSPREGRKIGHVTITGQSAGEVAARVEWARERFSPATA